MSDFQQSAHNPQFHQGRLRQEPDPDHSLRYTRFGDGPGEKETSPREHLHICVPPLHPALGPNRSGARCVQLVDSLRTASNRVGDSAIVSEATQLSRTEQGGHIKVKADALGYRSTTNGQYAERCCWTTVAGKGWQTDSAVGSRGCGKG